MSAVRTPFGRLNGGLASYPATELGAIAIRAGLERAGVDGRDVDHLTRSGLRQHCSLQRSALEHAQAAAAIALDPHEPITLARFQKIHQPAEAVPPLVEAAFLISSGCLSGPTT